MSDNNNIPSRVDWVDYAKGFCIVFVVMMHSTLGVEQAAGQEGFMHTVVAFAKPFRMPDFFLISGLFLAQVIDRDWRTYVDRKVVHFAYFYLLWTALQFAFKAPLFAQEHGIVGTAWFYVQSFWEPFGTLWFIYLLPIFFTVTKLARRFAIPPALVWVIAAALETAPIATGWTVIDEFAARFVFFYTGYLAARHVFALATAAQAQPEAAAAGLTVWGLVNGALVFHGLSELPLVSLGLGLVGAMAVVTISALMAKSDLFRPLRYCGRNSIVIYLAFFLPMALSRTLLLKSGFIADIGAVSLVVTATGVVGALALFWATRHTFLRFLFDRPARFWIAPKVAPKTAAPALALQPAE
ncbi:MAG TPA: acyltransferase family protein [Xanthobacteraceae bacterium]